MLAQGESSRKGRDREREGEGEREVATWGGGEGTEGRSKGSDLEEAMEHNARYGS